MLSCANAERFSAAAAAAAPRCNAQEHANILWAQVALALASPLVLARVSVEADPKDLPTIAAVLWALAMTASRPAPLLRRLGAAARPMDGESHFLFTVVGARSARARNSGKMFSRTSKFESLEMPIVLICIETI